MWESEDYNNVDALRDMIGIAPFWPDETPEEIKLEVIKKLTDIMPNYGYMYKIKGINVLGIESQKKMKQYLKREATQKPL